MNYSVIKKMDVADGPGVRVTLFVSGCSHHCKGCFNQETWDFSYGYTYTPDTQREILEALAPDYITGLTLLGGEPMEPSNRAVLLELVRAVREVYPDISIWCYSGYLCEDLLCWAGIWKGTNRIANTYDQPFLAEKPSVDYRILAELLSYIDVLVDGQFMEPLRNLMLKFRGSENQRLINLRETIREKKIILL